MIPVGVLVLLMAVLATRPSEFFEALPGLLFAFAMLMATVVVLGLVFYGIQRAVDRLLP